MKVAVQLAKNILLSLGITTVSSAIDAGIQKKIHVSGTTTLIISNKKMNNIMNIVQTLEDSNILLKETAKTFNNETKEQKGEFLGMLLGTLGAILLGNILTGRRMLKVGYNYKDLQSKEGREILRAGQGFKMFSLKRFLIPPYRLTNIEKQKY